jgi:hypothetical protein
LASRFNPDPTFTRGSRPIAAPLPNEPNCTFDHNSSVWINSAGGPQWIRAAPAERTESLFGIPWIQKDHLDSTRPIHKAFPETKRIVLSLAIGSDRIV